MTHEPRTKTDDEQQVVLGEIYAPDVMDSQGDTMSATEIQKMAYKFLSAGRVTKIDVNHDNKECGARVVESFIARPGDPDFIPGSWVLGVQIPDKALWNKVKSGELNGFSFEGLVKSETKTVTLDIPEQVSGLTDNRAGHQHTFAAKFGPQGKFLGGSTGETDNHSHRILAGTVTEAADGHTHRFSYVEGLNHGPA